MKIIVRDDGSSDGTRQILRNYAQTYSNIQLLFEDNCGAEESFNKLCQYSLQQDLTDYYAFCDQDDVWDNDKLSIAIQSLEKFDHLVPVFLIRVHFQFIVRSTIKVFMIIGFILFVLLWGMFFTIVQLIYNIVSTTQISVVIKLQV